MSGRGVLLRRALGGAGLCVALSAAAAEGPEFPGLEFHGFMDLRAFWVRSDPTWLDRELGKFRYGDGSGGTGLVRAEEGAVTARARLGWDWTATATLKAANRQTHPIDATEAFLQWRPASMSALRYSARLGAFFPPVSLENTGTGWTSPYSLTASGINSWVGEELRVFGGEAQLALRFEGGGQASLFGAGFGNNDTAGALLAWRGFSLHSYEATFGDRLPLPTASGALQRFFPQQALSTQPFVEVDGRPGYYLGLSLEQPDYGKFRALYYDNRARTSAIDQGQYAWHTRFASLGVKLDLPFELVFIGQGLAGRTQMGAPVNGVHPVDTRFHAYSFLLSKALGDHRFSLRHDRFGAGGGDLLPQDANQESGYAFTVNYNYSFEFYAQHQLNLEFVQIDSNRPARQSFGEAARQRESLWLLAYRVFF